MAEPRTPFRSELRGIQLPNSKHHCTHSSICSHTCLPIANPQPTILTSNSELHNTKHPQHSSSQPTYPASTTRNKASMTYPVQQQGAELLLRGFQVTAWTMTGNNKSGRNRHSPLQTPRQVKHKTCTPNAKGGGRRERASYSVASWSSSVVAKHAHRQHRDTGTEQRGGSWLDSEGGVLANGHGKPICNKGALRCSNCHLEGRGRGATWPPVRHMTIRRGVHVGSFARVFSMRWSLRLPPTTASSTSLTTMDSTSSPFDGGGSQPFSLMPRRRRRRRPRRRRRFPWSACAVITQKAHGWMCFRCIIHFCLHPSLIHICFAVKVFPLKSNMCIFA